MKHKTFEPCPDLASFVKCYWTLESPKEETPRKNTIVPDGCMKMIFHYGEAYRHHAADGNITTLPKGFVIGQLTRPFVVEPTGTTGIFLVPFHPNGFLPFSGIPIKEMENIPVPISKLFPKDGADLEQKILNAKSTQERIFFIENFLLGQLVNKQHAADIVKLTIEAIVTGNGQLSVDQLSKISNVTRRQLERKFAAAIGLSPKQLSKTIRLQSSLKMLLTKKVDTLTTVANEAEYYDQAHFIKDFKELTGITPKEFFGDTLKMSLIFDRVD